MLKSNSRKSKRKDEKGNMADEMEGIEENYNSEKKGK